MLSYQPSINLANLYPKKKKRSHLCTDTVEAQTGIDVVAVQHTKAEEMKRRKVVARVFGCRGKP